MNRTLKFRVWFIPTEEYQAYFLDTYHRKVNNLDCEIYTEDVFFDDSWIDTDDYESIEIEQYTGLNDKNGKEIYEGDIIQEFIDTGDENETRTYRYEVYWDEDTLCWSIKGYHDYDYNLHCDLWETNASREVIGNTHEGVKDESK